MSKFIVPSPKEYNRSFYIHMRSTGLSHDEIISSILPEERVERFVSDIIDLINNDFNETKKVKKTKKK
jgi:hypothetical protein